MSAGVGPVELLEGGYSEEAVQVAGYSVAELEALHPPPVTPLEPAIVPATSSDQARGVIGSLSNSGIPRLEVTQYRAPVASQLDPSPSVVAEDDGGEGVPDVTSPPQTAEGASGDGAVAESSEAAGGSRPPQGASIRQMGRLQVRGTDTL